MYKWCALLFVSLLVACSAQETQPAQSCSIDSAFGCSDQFIDGSGTYYFTVTNELDVPVSDTSVTVNTVDCELAKGSSHIGTLEAGAKSTVQFSCHEPVQQLSAELLIQYRVVSPYAGEPIRITHGTVIY